MLEIESMPPQRHLPPSTHPKVRQRSARACAPCRRRKIKCDGSEPCATCVGYGYNCVYNNPPPRSSTVSAASPARPAVSTEAGNPETSGPTVVLGGPLRDNEPFMASESLVEASSDPNPPLLKALKTRFTSIHSAVAYPRKLGMAFGLQPLPRLQSFAWNPGARPEPKDQPKTSICNIISVEQMQACSDVFFQKLQPHFGMLDENLYRARSKDFWLADSKGLDFEACICGVVALGSYFSAEPLPTEAEVVEQGRHLLDFSIGHPPAKVSVKHVVAWVLRAIYLRCTTRPHLSWMASCNAMHIAEANGLHRELSRTNCERIPDHQRIESLEFDLRRRSFWVACSFNQFLCSEYGRTKISLDMISCEPLSPQEGDFTRDVINIMSVVPKCQDYRGANVTELLDSLRTASELPVRTGFLGILRADACFCIYRMLRCTDINLPSCRITPLLEVIRVALNGVTFCLNMRQPWWNLTGTPFQSICTLLALGTSESLAMIPLAFETLKNTVDIYDSHLSREALRTAHALVQAARDKRSKEVESLDAGLAVVGELPPDSSVVNGENNMNFLEYPLGSDIPGFMDFLDLNSFYGNEEDTLMRR